MTAPACPFGLVHSDCIISQTVSTEIKGEVYTILEVGRIKGLRPKAYHRELPTEALGFRGSTSGATELTK
jgi:hypothetical protein